MSANIIAKTALRSARIVKSGSRAMSAGADHQVSAWGPMNFAGANWIRNGALPFNSAKRGRFLFLYWTFAIVGFGLPFANTELRVAPLREQVMKERREMMQASGAVPDN